jgi:hypothetical protein
MRNIAEIIKLLMLACLFGVALVGAVAAMEIKLSTDGQAPEIDNQTHFDEGNTRHVMLDIVLGNVMGYYKQQLQSNPNQPDIVEAIRRIESGVTIANADKFERKIIGTWTLVYKGTDTPIRDNMEIKLSTDGQPSEIDNQTHFDEGNTRHVMLDIVLGNVMGYYKQQLQSNPNQPDIVEAIRRIESGVTIANADKFERKIIGTWTLVYKGTDTPIRDNMEIKLSTDGQAPKEYSPCVSSGGTVVTKMCCESASDFPNTCVIGACGCSPTNSKETKVCDCGSGKCFDGTACVAN